MLALAGLEAELLALAAVFFFGAAALTVVFFFGAAAFGLALALAAGFAFDDFTALAGFSVLGALFTAFFPVAFFVTIFTPLIIDCIY
ncbi:MAG: hypothetical protein ACRENO_00295 [Thermodesulfobacteriota bacterium]